MPRIRTIKPEMASDRKMAGISRGARYTFVLLITQSDDDGLILGSPRQLLGQLYPHDEDVDLATLSRELRELLDLGLIRSRETTDGAPVVEICNWSKHQRIDHKAKSLVLPTLAPFSDESRDILAKPSRDTRAPTLDHGPTTMDLRPPTILPATPKQPASRPKGKAGAPPRETWITPFEATWERQCGRGSFEIGPALKHLAHLRKHWPDDEILRRMDWYLENKGSEAVLDPRRLAERTFIPSVDHFRRRFAKFDPSGDSEAAA